MEFDFLFAFDASMKPPSASETVLNEMMIHPSWSLWTTCTGLVENLAHFTVCCGSTNCSP